MAYKLHTTIKQDQNHPDAHLRDTLSHSMTNLWTEEENLTMYGYLKANPKEKAWAKGLAAVMRNRDL